MERLLCNMQKRRAIESFCSAKIKMTANDMTEKQCIEQGRIQKLSKARSFRLAETVLVAKSLEPLPTKRQRKRLHQK